MMYLSFTLVACLFNGKGQGQVLTIKEAIQRSLSNYGTLRAKANYIDASKALVKESSREYLPDLNITGQQDYGTVNAQNGPQYGYRGLGVASSGPVLASQNWNSAFGALYLTNINWDFFSFGRAKEKVKLSQSIVALNESDLEQEKFQQQVRVAGAYLNLLAAQRLTKSQQDNLDRTMALLLVVLARTKNGLNPGVDSSLAHAQVSNAKIALISASDYEQQRVAELAQLMGISTPAGAFLLDSQFVERIPRGIYDSTRMPQEDHPLLKYYGQRIAASDEQEKYYHTLNYPTFSLFGIMQGRASGFESTYGEQNLNAYTHNYWTGVDPNRANYLLGLGFIWNLTTPLRTQQLAEAQKFTSRGLKDEYDLINQNLINQQILSNARIKNAMASFLEAPIQVRAASDAYRQKTVMYSNGLSNIVDVTQALFDLNRAETDRDIADNNVWQALLLKAAASGDFGLFINEF
jgi:outer membrane protein TolC